MVGKWRPAALLPTLSWSTIIIINISALFPQDWLLGLTNTGGRRGVYIRTPAQEFLPAASRPRPVCWWSRFRLSLLWWYCTARERENVTSASLPFFTIFLSWKSISCSCSSSSPPPPRPRLLILYSPIPPSIPSLWLAFSTQKPPVENESLDLMLLLSMWAVGGKKAYGCFLISRLLFSHDGGMAVSKSPSSEMVKASSFVG